MVHRVQCVVVEFNPTVHFRSIMLIVCHRVNVLNAHRRKIKPVKPGFKLYKITEDSRLKNRRVNPGFHTIRYCCAWRLSR